MEPHTALPRLRAQTLLCGVVTPWYQTQPLYVIFNNKVSQLHTVKSRLLDKALHKQWLFRSLKSENMLPFLGFLYMLKLGSSSRSCSSRRSLVWFGSIKVLQTHASWKKTAVGELSTTCDECTARSRAGLFCYSYCL